MKKLGLSALGIGLLVAALAFAKAEPRLSAKTLASVEGMVNDKFRSGTVDPYDLLGTARCTYLDGYGALISVELQLVYVTPVMPFRAAYSPQELLAMHDRKVKKLPVFKETLKDLLVSAGTALDAIPPGERVAIEGRLWHYAWEDSRGIPQRILMSAVKSKLLDAQAAHADLATVITEQEQ